MAARSPWILSPAADAAFIVGAPLLCLATLVPLARVYSSERVWLLVMTFGAVGHHLPGFLRTYGDTALFRRHRARFLVAPPLVLGAALALAFRDLTALALVTVVWSLWHGMMQHYGFLRIYDAKVGAVSPRAARLDWLISASWFALCIVYGPGETQSLLEALANAGIRSFPPPVFPLLGRAVLALTIAVTALYLVDLVRARRRGEPRSAVKLVLLASATAYVYLVRVATRDPFLSVALFELLHDVQYLAIVWAFNRRQVEQGIDRSPISRALFRPGGARALVYVGACLLYGGSCLAATYGLEHETWKKVLIAIFATSGILHFYYDGFIWKLRQGQTRAGLGLPGGAGPAADIPRAGAPDRRALGHAAAFVLPLGLLAGLQLARPWPPEDRLTVLRAIARLVPKSPAAHERLGQALLDRGQPAAAADALAESLRLFPGHARAHTVLGHALLEQRKLDDAAGHLREAIHLQPTLAEAHGRLGDVLLAEGRNLAAVDELGEAIRLGERGARVHNNLGNALMGLHQLRQARAHLEEAVRLAPDSPSPHMNLGKLHDLEGRTAAARAEFEAVLRLRPGDVEAESNLGAELAKLGRLDEAATHLERALLADPASAAARANLARVMEMRAHRPPPAGP